MNPNETNEVAAIDPRPVMSKRDVSWHVTVAGIRASKKAEAAGSLPDARQALVDAAALEGGKAKMKPVCLATFWAFEATEDITAELVGDHGASDNALFCLTMLDPERVLLASLSGDLDDLRAGMLEMAVALPYDQTVAIRRHYNAEMARITALTGGSDGIQRGKSVAAEPSTSSLNSGVAPAGGSYP